MIIIPRLKKIIQFILIEMLYKKYVIEVVREINYITDVNLNTVAVYDNNIQLSLGKVIDEINVISFVNDYGKIIKYPHIFETYEKAFNILSTHYYNIKNDYSILTISIRETYNDFVPPLDVLRSMKLKQILK